MTETTVDARGLSCPRPAVMAKQAMRSLHSGTIEVLVDSSVARESIERIARMEGWTVECEVRGGGEVRLVMRRP